MLAKVAMPDPESVMRRYPHQLSGGMLQRCVIAMALMTNPSLLIMDEPTTALDVTTQAVVLDLVSELKREFDSAILYITHDLGVVAKICDRIGVLYAGEFVEQGELREIFRTPIHPYADLLGCVPHFEFGDAKRSLVSIPGFDPRATSFRGMHLCAPMRVGPKVCTVARPPLEEAARWQRPPPVGVGSWSAARERGLAAPPPPRPRAPTRRREMVITPQAPAPAEDRHCARRRGRRDAASAHRSARWTA